MSATAQGDGTSPEVSIVIPAHGVAPWISGSIQSALCQDENLEVIVVDDASPDGSAVMARTVAARDLRVSVIENDRARGVCGARNAGLERARAPWVIFLDGDDELLDGAVSALLAPFAERQGNGLVGAFGSFEHVDEGGEPIASSWLVDRADALRTWSERPLGISVLARRTFNPPPGAQILSTEAVRTVGGWDENRSGSGQSEDFELVMRVAALGSFAVVEQPVLRYLSRSSSRSNASGNNRRRALTRFEVVRRAPQGRRAAISRAQASAYWRLAGPRVRAGLRRGDLGLVTHGIQDFGLALAFVLWGLVVQALGPWSPSWPPLGE